MWQRHRAAVAIGAGAGSSDEFDLVPGLSSIVGAADTGPAVVDGPSRDGDILLDQDVVGQAEAKKFLAVAVYSHFRKSAKALADSTVLVKSNILLIGSTGTGKTLLCESLSRILGAPFVTADATTLAQSQFVNHEI